MEILSIQTFEWPAVFEYKQSIQTGNKKTVDSPVLKLFHHGSCREFYDIDFVALIIKACGWITFHSRLSNCKNRKCFEFALHQFILQVNRFVLPV